MKFLRHLLAASVFGLASLGICQSEAKVWEKLVAPGLTYRMEVDQSLPRIIHAYRFTPGSPGMDLVPALSKGTVFDPVGDSKGLEVQSETIMRTGALAAVNADFFPWTGDPIGAMVIGGELVSSPYPGRAMFAWGPGYFATGPLGFTANLKSAGVEIAIDGVNQDCGEDMCVLSTPRAALATASKPAVALVLRTEGHVTPNGTLKATAEVFVPDLRKAAIEPGTLVISAIGPKAEQLVKIARGAEVTITTRSTGVDWKKAQHAIGGGPTLLNRGKLAIDPASEKFSEDFSTKRHPRTAVGVTAAGDVWLVVIDGRQAMSRGATLEETALILQKYGCVNAINLDGGGSSQIGLAGLTLNRPSDGKERAVCNSLLVIGPAPAPVSDAYVIRGLPSIEPGKSATFQVQDAKGITVANADVIWAASGAGWIDQAGVLTGMETGTCTLRAWVRGVVVSVEVNVGPP